MYENGVDGEGEKGKGLLCDEFNEFVQNEVVYVPMTPAKTGQPDSDMIGKNWLENPFDEAIFEEQSMKKSFSCWKGSFGSTSQMYNRFSLDDADAETLSMSCRELLALATKNGSDCGAAGLTQQSGRLNMLCDLNLPPEMMADTTVDTGLSLQFTSLTPDQAKRMNLEADKEVVEANQDSEKGLTEQADLNETNETPQPKQKRRKHRPKVVTEGKPKRVRKPATPKILEVIIRRPKPEPKDTANIPPSNPDDPIDLESSPEHLVRNKAGKRKQSGAEAKGQPAKKIQRKKITRKGNLDAFISESAPKKPTSPVPAEPLPVVNELPPSPPRAFVADQLKNTEVPEGGAEKVVGVEDLGGDKPVDVAADAEKVISPEIVDGAGDPQAPELAAHDSEKEKTAEEIPVSPPPSKASGVMPENIEKVTVEGQGSFSDAGKNYPIRPDETLGDYYYRTYSERDASEIHAPVWNLKKGDIFSDWRVCRDWLQGIFPPGEVKFQESRLHEQTYHAYLEEAASYASTTHRIVREWHNMHKEWDAFKVYKKKVADDENRIAQLKAKLEADQAKFEADRKTEEWSVAGWKRKAEAEAAILFEERKNWKKICEKDNAEKMSLRNVINNLKAEVEKLKKQDAEIERLKKEKAEAKAARDEARSHRERSEQREVQTCATLALRDKEIEELTALLSDQEQLKKDLEIARTEKVETSRRLADTEEKLENSETARATIESELEPLKSDMSWLKERGIACVAESVLNSEELDKTVARLVVAARNDGYTQGYAECSHHVHNTLKVDWDLSRSATYGVDTGALLAALKTEFNNLQLPVMDLINVALQSEDHVAQLKEIFPDEDEDLA